MDNTLEYKGIHALVQSLTGKKCHGVVGGAGTGTVILLHMGSLIPRKRSLTNPNLSEKLQNNDSTHSIMVYCSWRIESESHVLTGSHHSNDSSGTYQRNFDKIENASISSIHINEPAKDLAIYFDNNMALVIHCSGIGQDSSECYTVSSPSETLTVHFDGVVTRDDS